MFFVFATPMTAGSPVLQQPHRSAMYLCMYNLYIVRVLFTARVHIPRYMSATNSPSHNYAQTKKSRINICPTGWRHSILAPCLHRGGGSFGILSFTAFSSAKHNTLCVFFFFRNVASKWRRGVCIKIIIFSQLEENSLASLK